MRRRLALALPVAAALLAAAAPLRADDPVRWLLPAQFKDRVVAAKKGRVLVVNFWATWCEPCREEMPELVAVSKKFRSKDVAFALVSLDSKKTGPTVVPKFLSSVRSPWPSWLVKASDPEDFINAVDRSWNGALPYTLVYDRAGRIYVRLLGKQTEAQFHDAISRAVDPP